MELMPINSSLRILLFANPNDGRKSKCIFIHNMYFNYLSLDCTKSKCNSYASCTIMRFNLIHAQTCVYNNMHPKSTHYFYHPVLK